jgi:hypothetical protein
VAIDRVQPLKIEAVDSGGTETDFFPTSLDRNEDYVDCHGVALQSHTSDDEVVTVDRDAFDNLVFADPVAGRYRLIDLLPGSNYDFLLDCEPDAINNLYANVRVHNRVMRETWTNTFTTKLIKSIDYTRGYCGHLVLQEIRKIYAPDGLTIVAQLTVVYTRTAGRITSAVVTRDI